MAKKKKQICQNVPPHLLPVNESPQVIYQEEEPAEI